MKKWIALSLALILSLSLCACGKDTSKNPSNAPTTVGGESGGNNAGAVTGSFNLLADVTVRYGDGDEAESTTLELQYDEDFDVIGYKAMTNGKVYSETTLSKDSANPLTQVEYNEDGSISNTYVYTYDANGKELSMVCTDEEGNIAYSVTNSYTSDGLLDTKTTDWGDSISWKRYTYDDQGNVLSFQSGNEDEIWADDVYKNTYDNGKLVDVQTYQDDVLRWNEQYDADGNLVLAVNYEYNGSESSRDVYTYENGRLLLRVSFFNGEEILRHEYTYNDAGQLTKLSYFDKGELYSSQIYLYEDSSLVGVKLYTQEKLEATYILSYETADVTNAQAKKLQALYDAFLDI